MKNMNKSYKKLIKKGIKLKSLFNSDSSSIKSNNLINTNHHKNTNKKLYLNKNDLTITKNKFLTNDSSKNIKDNLKQDFFQKTPHFVLKNELIKCAPYKNNEDKSRSNNDIKKVDASTQNNFFSLRKKESNFLKDLIEKIPKKNFNDIDYVLESPFRGVEKIMASPSKSISNINIKNETFYRPIYINNNYKGYFCLKNKVKNKNKINNNNFLSEVNSLSFGKKTKKYYIDKYSEIKRGKEIYNPLKKLSKISGVSCYKLREAINYSLNHKYNNFNNENRYKKENEDEKYFINRKKINNKNKYNNNIYSMITLKSKSKRIEFMNNDSINLDNEVSFENVISAKRRNIKNKLNI